MKLKSKILLISSITVLVTSMLCSVVILILVKKSFMREAESSTLQDAVSSFRDIEDEIEFIGEKNLDELVMEYIFKKKGEDFLICLKEDTEPSIENDEYDKEHFPIYNNTVFDGKDLEALFYLEIYSEAEHGSVERASLEYQGKHFFVYRFKVQSSYCIYKLEDVTYVWSRMELLSFSLIMLTLFAAVLASLILSRILKRVLHPLQELNIGAKQIACGRYDQRIRTGGNDEIGELSGNFNKMAEAVEQRTRSLEESERKKTLFMGNLTHELKTPLTAISGYAKTLLTVRLSEEDKEEALSYIYSESRRLERLSKKMMNLLLAEEETQIDLKKVMATDLFHTAVTACSKLLENKNMVLECHENGEVFWVDMDLMTDVLINLIDNAIKASEAGGKIILSANKNQITVRDFGMGIPQEEKDKILEPFYMVDKSRSRKSGGAGLGLAITAMILEKHKVSLSIESELGKGTCVILQFDNIMMNT